MKIKNKQVKDIYERWEKVWRNTSLPEESRLKAFSIMNTIEALVVIYEHGEAIDEESVDDLFIAWGVGGIRPVLPENRVKMIERMKENLRNMLSDK